MSSCPVHPSFERLPSRSACLLFPLYPNTHLNLLDCKQQPKPTFSSLYCSPKDLPPPFPTNPSRPSHLDFPHLSRATSSHSQPTLRHDYSPGTTTARYQPGQGRRHRSRRQGQQGRRCQPKAQALRRESQIFHLLIDRSHSPADRHLLAFLQIFQAFREGKLPSNKQIDKALLYAEKASPVDVRPVLPFCTKRLVLTVCPSFASLRSRSSRPTVANSSMTSATSSRLPVS